MRGKSMLLKAYVTLLIAILPVNATGVTSTATVTLSGQVTSDGSPVADAHIVVSKPITGHA